ncbi:MAG: hypothetical protein PVG41_13000 [Desulfobacteraceae bacterium]|jgi:hypothetical protein
MPNAMLQVIAFLLLGTAPVWAADEQGNDAGKSQVDDEQVIAVLELLELMELVQDMDLLKEMDYLIEGDPNEANE